VIGVLIFAGIVGYGIVYSGLADIQLGKGSVSIGQALLGSKAPRPTPTGTGRGAGYTTGPNPAAGNRPRTSTGR
jgi:hypothetical protein